MFVLLHIKEVMLLAELVYDEQALVDSQIYKYDKFLHSRINKYTGSGRTIVTYFSINDSKSSLSFGMNTYYQTLGNDSPLRYDMIENMIILGFSPLNPEDTAASTTSVRNYDLTGEGFIIPGTIMPKENDFFIVKHLKMSHIFRVTQVVQDGLNTDGSYKISYSLFSTNPQEIDWVYKQTVGKYVMDLQTVGGEDLTPVIGKEDYELRSRLISMIDDMVESYISKFYDKNHNCFICRLNGRALFDLCGNMFMEKHGVMIRDNANGNIVLNRNKVNDPRINELYQKSPYKWIERDAPIRYLETFKYHTIKGTSYIDSSFAMYGSDVDVMIPNDAWCQSPNCDLFFPMEVYDILNKSTDDRCCIECDCIKCDCRCNCNRHFKLRRFDYVSIIHSFIHGNLTSIHDLSLYTGDQLFDNSMSEEVYLWTPIIIYILKQTLKIK